MSVYGNIAGEIRGRIKCGQYVPGHKLESEPELAKTFGVARKTLRKSLLILESEGLLVRKKKGGTSIAQPGGKAKLGSQIYYFGEYDTHLFKEFFVCLMEEAQRRGISLNANDLEKIGTAGLNQKFKIDDVDESLMFVVQSAQYEKFSRLVKRKASYRTVLVDFAERLIPDCASYCVCPDFVRSGIEAVEHLLKLGHSRIAFIGTYPVKTDTKFPSPIPQNEFYTGYLSALARNGLSSAGEYAFYGFDETSIDKIVEYLKSFRKMPTGIVCHADFRAISAMKAANRLKLNVPADISIVGVGNTPWCDVATPELTSVAFDLKQMARMIIDLFSNPPPDKLTRLYVEPTVAVRKSTSAPKKEKS